MQIYKYLKGVFSFLLLTIYKLHCKFEFFWFCLGLNNDFRLMLIQFMTTTMMTMIFLFNQF